MCVTHIPVEFEMFYDRRNDYTKPSSDEFKGSAHFVELFVRNAKKTNAVADPETLEYFQELGENVENTGKVSNVSCYHTRLQRHFDPDLSIFASDRALNLNSAFGPILTVRSNVLEMINGPETLLADVEALRTAIVESKCNFEGIVAENLPWLGDKGIPLLLEGPAMNASCGSDMTTIVLRNSMVNATAISSLRRNVNVALVRLQVLDLGKNPSLKNAGAFVLAEAIAFYTKSLKSLAVDDCGIGIAGSKQILGTLLSHKINLHSLDMSFNILGREGTGLLSEWLAITTSLKELAVAGSRVVLSVMLRGLLSNPDLAQNVLEALDVSWNSRARSKTLKSGSRSNRMSQMVAGAATAVTSVVTATTSAATSLLGAKKTGGGADENLEDLELQWGKGLRIDLQSVTLLIEFFEKAAGLKWFKGSGLGLHHGVMEKVLPAVTKGMSDTENSPAAMEEDSTFPQTLIFNHNNLASPNVPWALMAKCRPVVLDLCSCYIGAKGIVRVCDAFQNSNIEVLRISHNVPSTASTSQLLAVGEAVANMLGTVQLRELFIAGDGTNHSLQSGILQILDVIGDNACPTLTSLDVSGNLAVPANAAATGVAKILTQNSDLLTLRWDQNNTRVKGLRLAHSALLNNRTMEFFQMPMLDCQHESGRSKDHAMRIYHWTQQIRLNREQVGFTAAVYDTPPVGSVQKDELDAQDARLRGVSVFRENLPIEERDRGDSVLEQLDANPHFDSAEEKRLKKDAKKLAADNKDHESESESNGGKQGEEDTDEEAEYDEDDDEDEDEDEDEDNINQQTWTFSNMLKTADNLVVTQEQIDSYIATFRSAEATVLSGWMMKRTRLSGKWKLRLFSLEGRMLCYYKDSTKSELMGTIDLTRVQAFHFEPAMLPPTRHHGVFSMDTGSGHEVVAGTVSTLRSKRNRKWLFAADINTSNGVHEWIGRISRMQMLASESRQLTLTAIPDLAGWLYKRDKARQWRRRYFKLHGDTISFSLDGNGNEILGVVHIPEITEMRLSSKTKCPKGSKAFKLVTANRLWVLASPRSQGKPETWMNTLQIKVPEAKIIDEKDYVNTKYGGYKMAPFNLELNIDDGPGSIVSQEELTGMCAASALLNGSHTAHTELLKKVEDPFQEAKTCSMACLPCTPPEGSEVVDEEELREKENLPIGTVLGWCSWCFGVPNGRCHEEEGAPDWEQILQRREGEGCKTWLVPKLKSPFSPKEEVLGMQVTKGGAKEQAEDDTSGDIVGDVLGDLGDVSSLTDAVAAEEGGDAAEQAEEDTGGILTHLGDVGDNNSLEDAVDMIASVGIDMASDDRPPKVPSDKLNRLFFRCTNCTR
jgi:hypothetical protein